MIEKGYLRDNRIANICKSFTNIWRRKPAGIDMERNYVTVTIICIHVFRIQVQFSTV